MSFCEAKRTEAWARQTYWTRTKILTILNECGENRMTLEILYVWALTEAAFTTTITLLLTEQERLG